MDENKVVNTAFAEFKQGELVNRIVSHSYTTIDDTYYQLISLLDNLSKMEGCSAATVLKIAGEVAPSVKVQQVLKSMFPGSELEFAFDE